MKSRNLTALLVEICGSVASDNQQGRVSSFNDLTRVQDLILSIVEKYEGNVVKKVNGALLVLFESPTAAVKAGMELQLRNRSDTGKIFAEGRIEIKVAIHSGEMAVSHDEAYGESITFLEDLQKIIDPGQVIFTEATYLSMSRSHIPEAEVGYYQVGQNVNRTKVFKIREEAIRVTRISSRSLPFLVCCGTILRIVLIRYFRLRPVTG